VNINHFYFLTIRTVSKNSETPNGGAFLSRVPEILQKHPEFRALFLPVLMSVAVVGCATESNFRASGQNPSRSEAALRDALPDPVLISKGSDEIIVYTPETAPDREIGRKCEDPAINAFVDANFRVVHRKGFGMIEKKKTGEVFYRWPEPRSVKTAPSKKKAYPKKVPHSKKRAHPKR
jgi:hypothetical protein